MKTCSLEGTSLIDDCAFGILVKLRSEIQENMSICHIHGYPSPHLKPSSFKGNLSVKKVWWTTTGGFFGERCTVTHYLTRN